MARKKRKPGGSVRRPAGAPPAEPLPPPDAERPGRLAFWLVPAAGLVLVASWLATLGALATGHLELRNIFEFDTVRPWLIFQDLTGGRFPYSGWRHGVSPFYITDYALLWPLFAAGMDFRAAMLLLPLLQVGVAAVGWIFVCDLLHGRSRIRRAAVLLLHALVFLILAWGADHAFYILMVPVNHYGTWASVPWLLWLTLRVLGRSRGAKGGGREWPGLAALCAALALSVASNLITLVFFILPAAAAAAVLMIRGRWPAREGLPFLAALAASYPAGKWIVGALPFAPNRNVEAFTSFNPERTLSALGNLLDNFATVASRAPLEAVVWLAFAGLAVWRALAVALNVRLAGGLRPAFGIPEGRAHAYVALFVPAAPLFTVAAILATGNFNQSYELFWRLGQNRYLAPLYFFPLFVGWALLPWRISPARGKLPPQWPAAAAAACAALAIAASAPRMAQIRAAALDPFNTPFHRCFAESAKRLGWRAGITTAPLVMHLRTNPEAGIERMLLALNWGAFARRPGESALLVDWLQINRHWFSGEFQFVAVNDRDGFVYRDPPGPTIGGCAHADYSSCASEAERGFFLDERSARAALGDPAEVVECEGVGFLHYDPPLTFNFGELQNPDLKVIGRRW